MGRALKAAAVFEAIFGVSFAVVPALIAELLLGKQVTGTPILAARVIGVGLVALGIACWVRPTGIAPKLMLAYNVLATVGLLSLGVMGTAGVLLWPAFLVHAVLTILLVVERRAASVESQA